MRDDRLIIKTTFNVQISHSRKTTLKHGILIIILYGQIWRAMAMIIEMIILQKLKLLDTGVRFKK